MALQGSKFGENGAYENHLPDPGIPRPPCVGAAKIRAAARSAPNGQDDVGGEAEARSAVEFSPAGGAPALRARAASARRGSRGAGPEDAQKPADGRPRRSAARARTVE